MEPVEGTATDTDVIVVGAGPTGLMLAGELRLGGARVVVIEKLAAPTGQSRGLGFTARAMETFDQRGLLPRFGQGESLQTSPMGHFGGTVFDFTVLPDAHFGARGIPQGDTEAVLEAWAADSGADIRRGWEFLSLADAPLDGDTVAITARTPQGQERTLRAAYLVGCDGGASRVRRAGGFDFPGSDARRGMYLADITGVTLRARHLGERYPNGMVMSAPLTEDVWRIIVCPDGQPAHDRERTVTYAEVAQAWRHITGEDIGAGSASWVSSFTDATRQASAYRRGRVLLAGDAAHIHLPAGGQGLSTGVQDAANLGWKLAAVLRGDAGETLLDTYHDERHAAGRRLLMNTRAQGTVYLGGAESEPLRALFTELIAHDDVKRHLAGLVSHLDLCYDLSVPGEPDTPAHPLTGRRMPPRLLIGAAGEARVAQLLHTGRGVLLDLADDPQTRRAAAGREDRVDVVTATLKPADGPDPLAAATAVLIRPDGYVAWASDETTTTGLEPALRHWFGPAR